MIQNAHQARELAKISDDPKLQDTLEIIYEKASFGGYSISIAHVSDKLMNNLKARGFSVYKMNDGYSITW